MVVIRGTDSGISSLPADEFRIENVFGARTTSELFQFIVQLGNYSQSLADR